MTVALAAIAPEAADETKPLRPKANRGLNETTYAARTGRLLPAAIAHLRRAAVANRAAVTKAKMETLALNRMISRSTLSCDPTKSSSLFIIPPSMGASVTHFLQLAYRHV